MFKLNLIKFLVQWLKKLINWLNLENYPAKIINQNSPKSNFNSEQILDKFDQFDQDFKGGMGANFKSKIAKCLISLALKFDPNPEHDYFSKVQAEKEKIIRNLIRMLDDIEGIYQTGNLDLQVTVTPCIEGAIADTINLLMIDFRQAITDLPEEHLLRQKYQNLAKLNNNNNNNFQKNDHYNDHFLDEFDQFDLWSENLSDQDS